MGLLKCGRNAGKVHETEMLRVASLIYTASDPSRED